MFFYSKKLFCTGFTHDQILFLIPVIDEYCKKENIDQICLDKYSLSEILKNKTIYKNFIKKYKIVYFEDFKKKKRIKIIFFLIFNFLKLFYISITLDKKKLLDKKNSWTDNQIFHAIWDLSYLKAKTKKVDLNFYDLLKSSIKIFCNSFYGKELIKDGYRHAFFGHLVYAVKPIILEFKKNNAKLYGHSAFCFFKLKKKESSWLLFDKSFIKYLKIHKIKKNSQYYWKKRIKGMGTNEDSRLSASFKNKLKIKRPNILMLHIFKDSPFNYIDRNRVFADYYDWVEKTLNILSKSNDKWIIKFHPSAEKWGENSEKVLKEIMKKVKNFNTKNIFILKEKISNIELFKNAKKIVTFSGTSHLEAACFGIKPIVISEVTLSKLNKNLVFKPRNIKQYTNYLLSNSKKKFILNAKQINYAREIIFILENILSFKNDIKYKHVYRMEYLKYKNNIRDGMSYVIKNFSNFKKIPHLLDSNLNRSFSFAKENYIKKSKIKFLL